MARMPHVAEGQSAAVDSAYAAIRGMGRPVLNLYRVLANQPPALAAFLEMSRYVRAESSLDPGIRELTILATAQQLGQEYELTHHTGTATRAGVPEVKVAAVKAGGTLDALSPAERAAVEFARQAAHTLTCDDETYRRLQSLFSSEEIVDLVVTTGWYHLCAVILESLRVELEEDAR